MPQNLHYFLESITEYMQTLSRCTRKQTWSVATFYPLSRPQSFPHCLFYNHVLFLCSQNYKTEIIYDIKDMDFLKRNIKVWYHLQWSAKTISLLSYKIAFKKYFGIDRKRRGYKTSFCIRVVVLYNILIKIFIREIVKGYSTNYIYAITKYKHFSKHFFDWIYLFISRLVAEKKWLVKLTL